MNARTRTLIVLVVAALAGVAGNALFGPSPAAVVPVVAAEAPWTDVGMRVPDLAAADAAWEASAPWGAAPKPEEPPPPPPPPPPVPVGIVGTGKARQALFRIDGTSDLRLGVGDALPDGGRVLAIDGMKVTWVDGAGRRHERRMFVDPVELPPPDQESDAPRPRTGAGT